MVDWLGLAGLSRLWIKTEGFSSLLALMLQTGDGGLGTETRETCHDNQSLENEETGSWPDS